MNNNYYYKEFYKTDDPSEFICKETHARFTLGIMSISDESNLFYGVYKTLNDAANFFTNDTASVVVGKVLLGGNTFTKNYVHYGTTCMLIEIIDKLKLSIVENDREIMYIKNGVLHCDTGPARVSKIDSDYSYYCNGLLHRDNGPAVQIVYENLFTHEIYTKNEYYYHGVRHRSDGPAVIYSDGDSEYYIYGVRHRNNGPAIDWSDQKCYYQNGLLHRLDGPAEIWSDGQMKYFINGILHREDGPAVIHSNGDEEYYINNKLIKKIKFEDTLANVSLTED